VESDFDCAQRARGGRLCRREAEQRDQRIHEVAVALFMERGFAATSIESIARRAGVAKRTIYTRYPDKTALFASVVRQLIEDWQQTVATLGASETDVVTTLQALGESLLRSVLLPHTVALIRIIRAEGPRFPDLARAVDQTCHQTFFGQIARLLQQEAGRGRLRLEDPHFAALQFHQLVVGVPLDRALSGQISGLGEAEIALWVERSVRLFLNGAGTVA